MGGHFGLRPSLQLELGAGKLHLAQPSVQSIATTTAALAGLTAVLEWVQCNHLDGVDDLSPGLLGQEITAYLHGQGR